ncbi:MAG: DinB family protein [Phycisphaerae bacterium]|nr:DinB family protein [Phycisphaerales bacterium]
MAITLEGVRTLLRYNDAANALVFEAAKGASDDSLDQRFPMGRGSLRRTLLHIWAGEDTWLKRWQGKVETPWPSEREPVAVSQIFEWMHNVKRERDAYIKGLQEPALDAVQRYRDSKGELFEASLADMLLQGCIHSTHHRAQAVNMLRNVDAGLVELDYMSWVRRPVES